MPQRRKNNSDGSKGSQGSSEVPVKLAPPPPSSPLAAPVMFMGPMPVSLSKASKHARDTSPASLRPSIHSSRSASAVPKLAIETNFPAAPSKLADQSTNPSKTAIVWKSKSRQPDHSKQTVFESPLSSSTATLTPSSPLPVVRSVMERGIARKVEGPGHIMFLSELRRSTPKDSEEKLMAGLGIDDGTTVADVKENLVAELMPSQADKIAIKPWVCLRTAVVSQSLDEVKEGTRPEGWLTMRKGNMLECLVQWDHDRAIARQIWPGSPPALSSLPSEQNVTKDEAAEVVERFRTAMCMLPVGEWRCRWAYLEEDMLLALLKMTFRLARPVLAWEMDTDRV